MSVVMVCHDQAALLETNIPHIMKQDFPLFEVIVVTDNCTDGTEEVLKLLERQYPRLHHTFIPASARYVSHQKLGITLGVKAARYDLIVLTHPDCNPASSLWLRSLSARFNAGTDIVLGYANYRYDHTFATKSRIYRRMMLQLRWFFAARKKAVSGDGCNMAFRRSVFMQNNGYAGRLNVLCGADDLLVEKLAAKGRTRVCCEKAARVEQSVGPGSNGNTKDRLLRMASQKRLSAVSKWRLLPWKMQDTMQLLSWALLLALMVVAGAEEHWAELAAVACLLLFFYLAEHLLFRRTAQRLDEPVRFFPLYVLTALMALPVWKLRSFAHRRDFIRKADSHF